MMNHTTKTVRGSVRWDTTCRCGWTHQTNTKVIGRQDTKRHQDHAKGEHDIVPPAEVAASLTSPLGDLSSPTLKRWIKSLEGTRMMCPECEGWKVTTRMICDCGHAMNEHGAWARRLGSDSCVGCPCRKFTWINGTTAP